MRAPTHPGTVWLRAMESESISALDELVERVREGDSTALAAMYRQHHLAVRAFARRLLGDATIAEDLVHDVFLEAWLHAGDYDPERGSLRSWLLLRLRSRALDRLGTAEATRTRSLEEGDPAVIASSLAPVIERADGIGLREAIGRLENGVREVLERTYFRGLTAQAIADQMNVPLGTVRSRLARGLRDLRSALGQDEHGEQADGGGADEP